MTRLWLVRHGITEWNESLRIQGQCDTDLGARGRWQAERAAEALGSRPLAAAYASDLKRAWETAQLIVGRLGLPVQQRMELREAHFGRYQGLTFPEIRGQFPDLSAAWLADRVHVAPPEGESLLQLADRVVPFAREMAERHPDQEVLVVSHGGPLRALLCRLLGMDLHDYWKLRVDNGSISTVDLYPEGAIVSRLNDVCHLGEGSALGDDRLSRTLGIRVDQQKLE